MSGPPPAAGHNNGPTLEPGGTWRRVAWGKARAALLPKLPIEILRLRVARARALGLDYKTYASVRASTGRDVVGFLFSSNALSLVRMGQAPPPQILATLGGIDARRIGLAQPPLTPAALTAAAPPLHAAATAPRLTQSWSQTRSHLADALAPHKLPHDAVLLVATTAIEREWVEAAKLAGAISPGAIFPA